MRLIFAGTPQFAAVALEALIAAGHEVVLVLTQADRPAGRGLKVIASAVKKVAQKHILRIEQPLTLKSADAQAMVIAARANAMIVAAYGLILPRTILTIPTLGCINVHPSLLPRWRGAAPIQRTLLAGDRETGVTLMQMDEGLDTGDILARCVTPIGETETAGELHDRLAILGAQLLVDALCSLPEPAQQDDAEATYASKISKSEARIDWRDNAAVIARKVRAYNPFPGAFTMLGDERIKIWRTSLSEPAAGAPGTVCGGVAGELIVACGQGALNVLELQRAGGKRQAADSFLAGFPIAHGMRFGDASSR